MEDERHQRLISVCLTKVNMRYIQDSLCSKTSKPLGRDGSRLGRKSVVAPKMIVQDTFTIDLLKLTSRMDDHSVT